MTAAAAPVSTAAEQKHHHNDNQYQFHGISPLMAMALFAAPQHSTASPARCSRQRGSPVNLHCAA
jgi:hypothetical protein